MNTHASSPSSGAGPDGVPADAPGVPGTGNGPGNGSLPGEQFFNRIRALGVARPDEGRWAAGVCAGLARRWGMDPLLVRGLFVVVSIVSGFGLGLYGLLWLFLPHPDGRIHAQQLLRGVVTAGFFGSVVFILIDLPLSNASWDNRTPIHPMGNVAFLVLVGLGIWWLLNRRSPGRPGDPGGFGGPGGFAGPTSAPASGAPASGPAYGMPAPPWPPVVVAPRPVGTNRSLRAVTRTTLGAALVAAGIVLGWSRWIGNVPDAGAVASALALGVIALGIVAAGLRGRRPGWLAPIAIVLAIVAANGASWQHTSTDVNSDQNWVPVTASSAAAGYHLGAGRAVLDLTAPGVVTGATNASPVTVPVSVGAGELVVVVPKGVSSQVDASVGLGAITDRVDGSTDRGGAGVTRTIPSGTSPVLIVIAKVGLGHVEVVPQGTELTSSRP